MTVAPDPPTGEITGTFTKYVAVWPLTMGIPAPGMINGSFKLPYVNKMFPRLRAYLFPIFKRHAIPPLPSTKPVPVKKFVVCVMIPSYPEGH